MSTIDTLSVKVGIDASDLEAGTDKVTKSVKGIGDSAKGAKPSVDKMGSSFDRVGDKADVLDTRAMGFRDTMTGVEDTSRGVSEIMKGNLFDGVLLLGMGFGDLASGVANFGVQFAKQAGQFVANSAKMVGAHAVNVAKIVGGWVLMGAQAMLAGIKMALAWLVGLGPIGILIIIIGIIIGVLIALGLDFDKVKEIAGKAWQFIQDMAMKAYNWLKENWPLVLAILTGPIGLAVLAIVKNWDKIKSAFGTAVGFIRDKAVQAKDWIVEQFNKVVSFITGLPGRVRSAASGLFDGFKDAFRSAINWIIGKWNGLSFKLPEFKAFGKTIGGNRIDTPNLPTLAKGGIVRARSGGTDVTVGEGGRDEAVIPLPRGMRKMGLGGGGVTINVAGSVISERELLRIVENGRASGRLRGAS